MSQLCRALDVAPSGFYAWCRRPESAHAQRDRRLRVLVRTSFEESKHRYGSPRILEDLLEQDIRVSRKRVIRLMQEDGLQARAFLKTFAVCSDVAMSQRSTRPTLYKGYRFPPELISHCVWLSYRFGVSLRDVSELMLARGIEVSHEAIRLWTQRFGTDYARRLRRAGRVLEHLASR